MLWRKFKLDWQYAIGEMVIVTAGVLIALWIQQWNDERLDRVEERVIIDRLSTELAMDIQILDFLQSRSALKVARLERLERDFESGTPPEDSRRFLEDIGGAANLGWNIPQSMNDTFEEVRVAGSFDLIQDADLRVKIARYYRNFRTMYIRADARETMFPILSYQLVPRGPRSLDSPAAAGILTPIDPNLSDEQVIQLAERALRSDIANHVTAEKNLARFIGAMTDALKAEHAALVTAMSGYASDLQ